MKSKRKILQIFTAFMAAVMLCPTGITVVASLQQSGSLYFTPGEGAAAADSDDQSWSLDD